MRLTAHGRRQRQIALAAMGFVNVVASACHSSSGGSSTTSSTGSGGSGAAGSDAGPGDPSILAGSFQVRLVPLVPASGDMPETPAYTSVVGKIYDGPTPAQIVWEEAAKEGPCRLLAPRVPFCSTPCGGSAVCVEDETCQDYPTAHSVGQVTVSGVHTADGGPGFTMSQVASAYQPPAGVTLLYPAFAEGEALSFAASGDYWPAFAVQAKGVSPLLLTTSTIQLEADQPVNLGWAPPGQAGISTIHVKLDISHHGGTKGTIECDAEDTGSLELPASLITELLGLGVAGFPSIVVTRQASGSVTIAPGRVDLVVSSIVERAVQISGLTSCTSDTDCPDGQACQADLTCS